MTSVRARICCPGDAPSEESDKDRPSVGMATGKPMIKTCPRRGRHSHRRIAAARSSGSSSTETATSEHVCWPGRGRRRFVSGSWMLALGLLILLLLGGDPVSGVPEGPIRFASRPQIYRSKVGDSIQMDCQVENLGSTVITWYKGDRILSAGDMKILAEPRVKILPKGSAAGVSGSGHHNGISGISVFIRDVKMADQDTYACEVNLKDAPIKISHKLEVLVPPSIHKVSGNGRITARKGSKINLNCTASGHPKPEIHWERQHHKYFSSGRLQERGAGLELSRIGREDEGVYVCVAHNNVGDPVTAKIVLNVLYPPEVVIEDLYVHSGPGESAKLECVVQGNPEPTVNWYKGSMKLSDGERHSMLTIGKRYQLTINPVSKEDFGNYSCVSENQLGKARGTETTVELTGSPTRAEIISRPSGQHRYSYHLKWSSVSKYAILQHRIEYAAIDATSKLPSSPSRIRYLKLNEIETQTSTSSSAESTDPTDSSVLSSSSSRSNAKVSFAYNIKGLHPQTRYSITVQTQNEEGWSPPSQPFTFTTSHIENFPKELQSRPEDEIIPVSSSRAAQPRAAVDQGLLLALLSAAYLVWAHRPR